MRARIYQRWDGSWVLRLYVPTATTLRPPASRYWPCGTFNEAKELLPFKWKQVEANPAMLLATC